MEGRVGSVQGEKGKISVIQLRSGYWLGMKDNVAIDKSYVPE